MDITIYCVIGVSGSGKSWVCRNVVARLPIVYINIDHDKDPNIDSLGVDRVLLENPVTVGTFIRSHTQYKWLVYYVNESSATIIHRRKLRSGSTNVNEDAICRRSRKLDKVYMRYGHFKGTSSEVLDQITADIRARTSGKTFSSQCSKYTDEGIIASAKKYATVSEWKRADPKTYRMSTLRPSVHDKAVEHMVPAASPYAGDYQIYAYTFSDNNAYIGLTFKPKERHAEHLCRGPVFDHIKVCHSYTLLTLEDQVCSPTLAVAAEKKWIAQYAATGWTMLNTAKGGSTGSVLQCRPDTDIIATAHQYQSKTAWLLADQSGYKLAKARGIFAACVADMPRRKPRDYTAIAVTAETREKMRRAKLGRHQSAETVQKRSQAMLRHYASADPVKEAARLAKVTGRKRGWLLTADEMAYLHKDQVRCELAADEKRLLRNYRHARDKVNAVTS